MKKEIKVAMRKCILHLSTSIQRDIHVIIYIILIGLPDIEIKQDLDYKQNV